MGALEKPKSDALLTDFEVCEVNLDRFRETHPLARPNPCDATHLMLTVNAALAEGITSIATVHDSFGCPASQAERFRHIIREQFVRMYEENDASTAAGGNAPHGRTIVGDCRENDRRYDRGRATYVNSARMPIRPDQGEASAQRGESRSDSRPGMVWENTSAKAP